MSDSEKTEEVQSIPAPAVESGGDKKDLINRMRERGRQRPASTGKVPSLQGEMTYSEGRSGTFEADLERELDEAMAGFNGQEILADTSPRGRGQPQGPKKGKVFRIHPPDVFIEMPGSRTQGVLPMLQFPEGVPALGTKVEVNIEGFDNANGVLLLTRKGGVVQAEWGSIEVGQTVEARVTGTNKGGLEVDVNGIRGFLPISQIDLYRVEDVNQFVNQRLVCVITEADRVERNLIVSRRALLEKEREENREKLWTTLAEGQVHSGIVRSVKEFGAFVDIGGVDGLLHISEMSWTRVSDASKVVQPGQALKVVVLKIDRETRKVGFGLRQLTASPWDDVEQKYPVGSVFPGKVTRIENFGAFVELEPAIEGLIHISELAPQRVHRVIDVVKPGQEVKVAVLSVDKEQHRISLSLKAALPKVEEPEPPQAVAKGEEPMPAPKPPRPRTTPLRGGLGAPVQFPPLGGST